MIQVQGQPRGYQPKDQEVRTYHLKTNHEGRIRIVWAPGIYKLPGVG